MFDRIYTIGCFDFFHDGHRILLEKMRGYGKEIIVGIHDDESIEKLKNLTPDMHEDIKTRMKNIKQYADIVYVIPDTDPTFFIDCVIKKNDNKLNACYIRGNDMPNFPGRDLVESKISVLLVPYSKHISSTQIRKELFK